MNNLIQFLVSYNLYLITKIFRRFSGIFKKKTTFEEFEEICEQIHSEQEIQYNDDLLTNFF